ncbi:MAG: carbohydrate ABC transporter substrate-binding protein, partial [Lachnospiraceae bacterium]|nr:carbohydrate ABC transporter substrate-binding protein [Lachnospiraceae bacterium]
MKKKLLSVFLCAAMTMSLFTGCGGSGSAATGTDAGSTDASGDAEAVTETAASGEGSVYWLNFKPELDETIQELGKK